MSCRTGRPDSAETSADRHRDTGRRTILRDRARRHVDVHVPVEHLLRDAQPRRVRAGVGPRRARRFLHHVAQLAGEHQLALAAHGGRLDEHDVAAHRRVVHAGRDADLVGARRLLRDARFGRPSRSSHHRRRRPSSPLDFLRGDLARHLARQLADLALQLAHARLAGVAR